MRPRLILLSQGLFDMQAQYNPYRLYSNNPFFDQWTGFKTPHRFSSNCWQKQKAVPPLLPRLIHLNNESASDNRPATVQSAVALEEINK